MPLRFGFISGMLPLAVDLGTFTSAECKMPYVGTNRGRQGRTKLVRPWFRQVNQVTGNCPPTSWLSYVGGRAAVRTENRLSAMGDPTWSGP